MRTVVSAVVLLFLVSLGGFARGGAEEPSAAAPEPAAPRVIPDRSSSLVQGGSYLDYATHLFADAVGLKRVLFFHASWCPTCRAADRAFFEEGDRIPGDVALFKTDYDSYDGLKRQFGVTYQHTFVLVDDEGNLVEIWNGGDVERLIQNTL